MPRSYGPPPALTPYERRALLERMLDVISWDEAVRTVYVHAKCVMDDLKRDRERNGIIEAAERERILAAVASARAVRPALQAQLDTELANQQWEIAHEQETRRMHAERPSLWQSFEKRCEAALRRVEFVQRDLAWVDALLAEHAPDGDMVEPAAQKPEAT